MRLTDSNQLQLTIAQMSLELVSVADMANGSLGSGLDGVEVPSGRHIDNLLLVVALHGGGTENDVQGGNV